LREHRPFATGSDGAFPPFSTHCLVESAKPEAKIGFWEYFRVGLAITVMTLIVGWAWLEWVK
jgi:hypothetical protein